MVRKIPMERKRLTFFKIILPGYSTEHLRIPPKFRKHIMNEMLESATLSLKESTECSWNVKVRKSQRDVYFEDGWQKFLRDNSLGDHEFLLFNYYGKMHFSVRIFNKNGCERDGFPDTETQDSTHAESTKKRRGRPRKHTVNCCKENSAAGKKIASCESDHLKEVEEEEKDEAAAESTEPFPHFTRKISGIAAYRVYVPKPFYKEHLASDKFEFALLKISHGKIWYKVKLTPYCDTVYMTDRRVV